MVGKVKACDTRSGHFLRHEFILRANEKRVNDPLNNKPDYPAWNRRDPAGV